MPQAIISPEFEIALPEETCERLGLSPGDTVSLIERDGAVVVVPLLSRGHLRGIARGADTSGYRDETDRL
jgi:bifunctional DNA-binding transcriptional regulator/antitoxin component of YhaV-PrlF toxin-antitoxin module